MKIRQKKKFKLLDPKYNSYFIIKFINNFTKNGEKNRMLNIIYKIFKKIKRIFNFNTMLFLKKFLKENKPLIIAKNITIAGKLFHIPKFILEYQKEIKVIMWFILLIKQRKEKTTFLRILYEFITLFNSETPGYYFKDKNIDIIRNVEKSKKYSHYRW